MDYETLTPKVAMEIVSTLRKVRDWAYVDAHTIMGHLLVRRAELEADDHNRFSDNASRLSELQLLIDELFNLEEVEAFKAAENFNAEMADAVSEDRGMTYDVDDGTWSTIPAE
jgi:hypothetical protein